MTILPPPQQLAIETAIEALIGLLDCFDGEADLESDIDEDCADTDTEPDDCRMRGSIA